MVSLLLQLCIVCCAVQAPQCNAYAGLKIFINKASDKLQNNELRTAYIFAAVDKRVGQTHHLTCPAASAINIASGHLLHKNRKFRLNGLDFLLNFLLHLQR